MKRLIFLLFPVMSYGQIFIKDTALYPKDTTPWILTMGTTSGTISLHWDTLAYPRKFDTVRVIMQVSDTTFIDNFESRMMFNDSIDYAIPHYLAMVWWQYGYMIRELHIDTYYDPDAMYVDEQGNIRRDRIHEYWVTVGYLDPYKKPTPKSLVIWQIKQL